MATRFYFRNSSSGAPIITPAFDSVWTNTASADRRLLTPDALAGDSVAGIGFSHTAGQYRLYRQYISEPLAAGNVLTTFTTYSLLMAGAEEVANDNVALVARVRVLSEDGLTVRATIGGGTTGEPTTSSLSISFFNGNFGPDYTTVAGDRLVIELGGTDVAGTTPFGSVVVGSDSALSDFTTAGQAGGSFKAWFETSADLFFPGEAPPPAPSVTPTPAAWSPLVPAGGFGGHTDWPAINPTPRPQQEWTFLPTGSVHDVHIADVSVTKLLGVAIKAYRSTAQSINDSTNTNITYDTVSYRLAFKDPGASFTAFTIPYDGVYLVQATIEYAADADGVRSIGFEIDGDSTFHEGARLAATPTGVWRCAPVMVRRFTAGQTIEVITNHTAGAATDINAGEDNNSFSATYLFRI